MNVKRNNYNNIWFTSDFHYNHDRSFIWEARGFSSIKEHDDYLIDTFNSLVNPDDIVFNMGDFCFSQNTDKLISALKCNQQYFIIGNHDNPLRHYLHTHEHMNLGSLTEITILDGIEQYPIILSHYAMLVWNRSHYGSWHLCGHNHGKLPASLPDYKTAKRCDVGVDVGLKFNDTFLFTFEHIMAIMENKQVGDEREYYNK